MRKFFLFSCPLLLLLPLLAGCGSGPADQPEVAEVKGTILIDGAPKENLQVTFTPESGRPSQGITDGEGRYVLSYNGSVAGAKIDQHKVQIITMNVSTSDRIEDQKPFKETVPKEYNTETTLTATVTADGDNEFDFDVKTK